MRRRLGLCLLALLLGLSGCTSVGPAGPFGAKVSSASGAAAPLRKRVGDAARDAALAPSTWVPLAGAALLAIGSLDENLADWASTRQPLFGSDAADWSDDLRDVTTLSYFVAAALVPSEHLTDRFSGVVAGVGTLLIEGTVTEGLKSASSRQRPNGLGDRSFPSGHAAQASSRAALTLATLQHAEMAPWQRRLAHAGAFGIAGATAWARVEAGKHYPTDVLVGFAIGQFLAGFTQRLLFGGSAAAGSVRLAPQPGGGRVTVTVPLR